MVAIGITGNGQTGNGGGFSTGPLIDIEKDFGARGDSPTFDGPALRDALLAAAESRGTVVLPTRFATYRVNATSLIRVWDDGQYCAFPIPRVAANESTAMLPIAVRGPLDGTPVMGRQFNSGGTTALSQGAPIIQIEYDEPFAWDPEHGLPSIFATPDADFGGSISAVHVTMSGIIMRQPDNPSVCNINLENAAACDLDRLYFDTMALPDQTSEPTHPTGAALLLPRTGNAAIVQVGQVGAWGYYAGPAISEHSRTRSQFVIACRIALPIRTGRGFAHTSIVEDLTAEECTYGIAGWDPSGEGPALGVVPAPGAILRVERYDVEDYDRQGAAPWMYAPKKGAHIYDPTNALHGSARYARVDSGPDHGEFNAIYVVGADGFAVTDFNGNDATRAAGHAPSNTDQLTIFTNQTPTNSGGQADAHDVGSSYSLGTLFTSAIDGTSVGARWFFPTTLPSQPVTFQLYQWIDEATGTLLASKALSGTPVAGDWNEVTWDTPVALTADQRYVVQAWTADHYVFGAASTLPAVNGNLTAPADDINAPIRNGRLHVGGTPAFADSHANGLCFFVDVLFEEA